MDLYWASLSCSYCLSNRMHITHLLDACAINVLWSSSTYAKSLSIGWCRSSLIDELKILPFIGCKSPGIENTPAVGGLMILSATERARGCIVLPVTLSHRSCRVRSCHAVRHAASSCCDVESEATVVITCHCSSLRHTCNIHCNMTYNLQCPLR